MFRGPTHNPQYKVSKQLTANHISAYERRFKEIIAEKDLTERLSSLSDFANELLCANLYGESKKGRATS